MIHTPVRARLAGTQNIQAYLFMTGIALSGSNAPRSEAFTAATSSLPPCAMYSSFSISCSFSVSEAISFRPRVISIFSIFDSISTSLLISITAVLESASMMETSCAWNEKMDMVFRLWRHERRGRSSRELFMSACECSYDVKHEKRRMCVAARYP